MNSITTTWNELASQSLEDVLTWAEGETWAQAMAECQQDAEWHAEGDVWIHTKMVCRQLPQLDHWENLTPDEQTILLWTALFHDSCKPMTSKLDPETGRIRSPKHSLKGEFLARNILRELGCPHATREAIAKLVRYHGRPVFLLDKPDPAHEVVSLSWLLSNKLLHLFALADHRGRAAVSDDRAEDTLHLWQVAADEQNCYEQPYAFANDHARFLFYNSDSPNLYYIPHEDYRCTVTVMSGLPGSGKDTWLSQHRENWPVVSLDEIRRELHIEPTDDQGQVAQVATEQCRELLRNNTSFAFSATNLLRQTRQRWLGLFADYQARIEIVSVEPAFETVLKQNAQREYQVPEKVIRKMATKYEPPNWTEAHQLLVVE